MSLLRARALALLSLEGKVRLHMVTSITISSSLFLLHVSKHVLYVVQAGPVRILLMLTPHMY